MNTGITTKEFNDIAVEGMRFCVLYNRFRDFPLQAYTIVTYIRTVDCCGIHCDKKKNNECYGHGVFKDENGDEIEMCMSWSKNDDKEYGCTYIEPVDVFLSEDEFEI